MKKLLLSILLVVMFINIVSAKTLIVPIDGEINSAKAGFVEESLKNLNSDDTAIIRINTYGGAIISAEEIRNSIMGTDAKTISVVDNKAESAGVLITISSDKVYMVEGATIGSAEPIPNTEKTLSYWRSILSDTAERKNRDAQIIMSMADSDIEIDGIIEKGKLLNLNANKSKELGITDEVVKNFDDVLKNENISEYEVAEMDFADKFLDFISSQSISSLLLIVGMAAMVIELFIPGFGIGGIISIIAFGLFFTGNFVAGNSSWYSVAIFILGLILVGIEIMMPGFGIAGIGGIISIVTGLLFAMGDLGVAVKSLATAIIITGIIIVVMVKNGHKLPLFNKLTLKNTLSSDKGFVSVDNANLQIGDVCITVSVMKPIGDIRFNEEIYEAISLDGYIEKGTEVEVCKIEKSKNYVRRK